MSSTAPQRHTMRRSSSRYIVVDLGENAATQKTGHLAAGDTAASATVTVGDKPASSSDPTLGSVTVPTNTLSDDINGRVWSTGEALKVLVTTGASQAYGPYRLDFAVTTTNAETFPVSAWIDVVAE